MDIIYTEIQWWPFLSVVLLDTNDSLKEKKRLVQSLRSQNVIISVMPRRKGRIPGPLGDEGRPQWGSPPAGRDPDLPADSQPQVNCCHHVSSAASTRDWKGWREFSIDDENSLPVLLTMSPVVTLPDPSAAVQHSWGVREPNGTHYPVKDTAGVRQHQGRLRTTVPPTQFASGPKATNYHPYRHRPF